jgi:hypothetical protein
MNVLFDCGVRIALMGWLLHECVADESWRFSEDPPTSVMQSIA